MWLPCIHLIFSWRAVCEDRLVRLMSSRALFSPWKLEAKFARNDKGRHKNLHYVPLDPTLKSAADFMEVYKHFLEGCRETGTQTLALLFLGKVYEKKKQSKPNFYNFLSVLKVNHVFTDVLGFQQTSWIFSGHELENGEAGKAALPDRIL